MKDIILFGVQWAWKWTQAQKILTTYQEQYSYFSTWDFFRAISGWGPNAIGEYVKHKIQAWELIADEVTIAVFDVYIKTIQDANKAMLLDWYPRSKTQIDSLLWFLRENNRDFIWIFFDLSESIAIQRMLERWRSDDTQDSIKKRLDLYRQETQPIIDYFADHAPLVHIDASADIDTIFEKVQQALA